MKSIVLMFLCLSDGDRETRKCSSDGGNLDEAARWKHLYPNLSRPGAAGTSVVAKLIRQHFNVTLANYN